jgi:hypothetical protein
MNQELKAVFITLILTFGIGFLSIEFLGEYGWTIFIFLPLLLGFLPVFILGKKKKLTKREALLISFSTLGAVCVGLLIFAIEGLICIAMASPLLALFVYAGSIIAYESNSKAFNNSKNLTIILLFVSISFMSFDYLNKPVKLIPVKTKIIVNAPIDKVWNNVVTFDEIDQPVDWIFKTGISYPTDATIVGTGVGAIRYCNFTTGSFVEPITTWNEPNLLQFDVKEQPIPMNEFNPFWEVHPPHLDGYFKSYKGQFKLTKISKNKTELEGTTWYKIDIQPEFYWKVWSDFIIHRIHNRVLNHIKNESELIKTIE